MDVGPALSAALRALDDAALSASTDVAPIELTPLLHQVVAAAKHEGLRAEQLIVAFRQAREYEGRHGRDAATATKAATPPHAAPAYAASEKASEKQTATRQEREASTRRVIAALVNLYYDEEDTAARGHADAAREARPRTRATPDGSTSRSRAD